MATKKIKSDNYVAHTGIAKTRWIKLNTPVPAMSVLIDGVNILGC